MANRSSRNTPSTAPDDQDQEQGQEQPSDAGFVPGIQGVTQLPQPSKPRRRPDDAGFVYPRNAADLDQRMGGYTGGEQVFIVQGETPKVITPS